MTTQKKEHPFAEVLRWIANGEEVEVRICGSGWRHIPHSKVLPYICVDAATPENFRLKRKTIKIGDVEVPEPMRTAPEIGCECYLVDLISGVSPGNIPMFNWTGESCYNSWLQAGLCYTSREDAWEVVQVLQKLLKTD